MAFMSYLLLLALSLVHHLGSCIPQVALESVSVSGDFLQTAALPESAAATTTAGSCNACHIVADVAGLVWYSEVFINTAATAVVQVGVGNGTRATRTAITQNEGAFTFNPGNTAPAGALTQINYEPTVNVGGAQLTSPTAYNVFTAYSITSAYSSNGVCMTTSGSASQLPSAYSELLPMGSGGVTLDANGLQSFIKFLGFSTCSGGQLNYSPTALIQVLNTTATQTSTFSNVPLAEFSASLTIAPQSSPASVEAGTITGGPSTTVFPSVGAPKIVVGNQTITPSPNPIALPIYHGNFTGTATNLGGGTTGYVLSSGNVVVVEPSGGYDVLSSGSLVAVEPSGGYGNFSGPGTFPFLGAASVKQADAWLGIWIAVMVGLGTLVIYL